MNSPLSEFTSGRRAPRETAPYRADCKPSVPVRNKWQIVTRATRIQRRHRAQPTPEEVRVLHQVRPRAPRMALSMYDRMHAAEALGYARGIDDVHHETENFETGGEYLAWLKGHRAGQAEMRRMKQVEAEERVCREAAALRLLAKSTRTALYSLPDVG